MAVARPHVLERQCEDECGAKPTEGSHAAKSPMIMNSDLVNMMVDEQAREADDETENERNAKVTDAGSRDDTSGRQTDGRFFSSFPSRFS